MKNKPAFPISEYDDPKADSRHDHSYEVQYGMTLKEYYIGQLLASAYQGSPLNNKAIAKNVISLADEVIDQLEKDDD